MRATMSVYLLGLLFGAGLVMIPFVAYVAWLSTRPTLPVWTIWSVIAMNVVWAVDCAIAAFGGKKFIHHGVEHKASHQLALAFQGNGNGKHWDAMEKVCSAIERIDDPAVLRVIANDFAFFFHQERIAGPCAREFSV